jgi:8-oxo-dGTP pyrophosphatase MutT (NUDIX family)
MITETTTFIAETFARMARASAEQGNGGPVVDWLTAAAPGRRGNVWFVTPTPIWRPTARILVADPEGRVLLFSAREADGERWWFTPGGGVHRGETVQAAAVRELFEETGYAVAECGLGPVVATSSSLWLAKEEGKLFLGAHSFFFLRVPDRKLNTDGQEDLERSMITGHHWWSVADLRAATERIAPLGLAGLLDRLLRGDTPPHPVRLPRRR